jgi:hypothetical protein
MIGGIRLIKILPTLALVALVVQFVAMWHEARVKTAQLALMEQAIETRDAAIRSLEEEAVALVERHLEDLAAVEAELERQTERAGRYRAARESLEGLEDGEVAPVLRRALEALR